MYVTYGELIQFIIMITCIAMLVIAILKYKK